MDKIIYTCIEHVDMALDDFVNEEEQAPSMEKCDENRPCNYCNNTSTYKLSK